MFKLPENELEISYARSPKPGGQNVNKRNTKAIVRWNIHETTSLSDEERERVMEKLTKRISRDGWLQVTSYQKKSQHQNREQAKKRMEDLVQSALEISKERVETKVPQRIKRKRRKEREKLKQKKADRRKDWR